MEQIGDRLRAARKALKMTQIDFAASIGMTQGGYSPVESGARNITERALMLACSTHNISEEYLRHGTGEMFVDHAPEIVERMTEEFSLDEQEKRLVLTFLEFPPEKRRQIIRLMDDFSRGLHKHDEELTTEEKKKLVCDELDAADAGSKLSASISANGTYDM